MSHEAGVGVPLAPEFFGAEEQNRPMTTSILSKPDTKGTPEMKRVLKICI